MTPSWEEVKPEDQGRKILHIDPGTAFGTGMHETTQLCIRQLKKYITPQIKDKVEAKLDEWFHENVLEVKEPLYLE